MSARMRDATVVTWMLLVLLLNGCSTESKLVTATTSYSGDGGHPILVVSRGWHTGIVLAADLLTAHSPVLQERFADAAFLEVGWGDEAYYQAGPVTFGVVFTAALVPSSSVVYVVAVPQTGNGYFSNSEVRLLCAKEGQARALARFIAESFARDADGRLIERQCGNNGNSQFYAARGSFHLLNTCNTWTAKGLQHLGMDISPTLKLTAGSVMSDLAEHDYFASEMLVYEACGRRSAADHD